MFLDRMRWAVITLVVATGPLFTSCTATSPSEQSSATERLHSEIPQYLKRSALTDVRAIIVSAHDRVVFEEYYDSAPEEYANVFSVTKSVTSTLVGLAVDEGLLRVDQTLVELLPAYADVMSPQVKATTLEQLLTMTGGFPDTWSQWDAEAFADPDWVASCLRSQGNPAGSAFAYSDPGTHIVGAILVQATGRPMLDYAREKLFGPLGIDTEPAAEPPAVPASISEYEAAPGFVWPVDPQGVHIPWSFLKLRAEDMLALGSLYLHGGRWKGEQILSEAWVREATSAHVPAEGTASDYGYFWWVGTADGSPAYMAWGYGGQLIAVVPDRELVAVISSDVSDPPSVAGPDLFTYLLDKVIAPAIT